MLEQAQIHVTSQIDVLKDADARAIGLLAVNATLSAAGLTVAATQLVQGNQSTLFWAAVAFTIAVAIATGAAAVALWPMEVFLPGLQPAQFKEDIDQGKEFADICPEVIASLSYRIDDNKIAMKRHGLRTQISMTLLGSSPMCGAAGAFFSANKSLLGCLALAVPLLAVLVHMFANRSSRD